jgi:hypothetical protein
MRGWTDDGTEVELFPHQEQVVQAVLDWDEGQSPTAFLCSMGRGGGKSVVMATIEEYRRRRRLGYMTWAGIRMTQAAHPEETIPEGTAGRYLLFCLSQVPDTARAMATDPQFAASAHIARSYLDITEQEAGAQAAMKAAGGIARRMAEGLRTVDMIMRDPVVIPRPSDDLIRDLGGDPDDSRPGG